MLVHPQFVFLKVPKTGCTFVADSLRREFLHEVTQTEPKHLGWESICPDAAGRPVLAYVRNPWDWYVSWYHFNLVALNGEERYFKLFSSGGSLDFAATVRRACTLYRASHDIDLCTFWFKFIMASGLESGRLTVGRFESLVDDLERFLAEVDVEVRDGGMARIRAGAPLNASTHRPYREYYDDDLRDLVGESCRWTVDRFGYEF